MKQSVPTRQPRSAAGSTLPKPQSSLIKPDLARIEKAMRALKPDYREWRIPHLLQDKYSYFVSVKQRRSRSAQNSPRALLKDIQKHTRYLLMSLCSLSGPAIADLREAIRNPKKMSAAKPCFLPLNWEKLVGATITVTEVESILQALLNGAIEVERNTRPRKRGVKLKDRAREIALNAAHDFYDLTGEPPTRVNDKVDGTTKMSGRFTEFLSEIFGALEVGANVDYYARYAISLWGEQREEPSDWVSELGAPPYGEKSAPNDNISAISTT